uniref:Uncharacterized protein n=1 Tax=Solanum lycopersicum TaxID=4081 RepID=A0A3Q7ETH5_SOLLC
MSKVVSLSKSKAMNLVSATTIKTAHIQSRTFLAYERSQTSSLFEKQDVSPTKLELLVPKAKEPQALILRRLTHLLPGSCPRSPSGQKSVLDELGCSARASIDPKSKLSVLEELASILSVGAGSSKFISNLSCLCPASFLEPSSANYKQYNGNVNIMNSLMTIINLWLQYSVGAHEAFFKQQSLAITKDDLGRFQLNLGAPVTRQPQENCLNTNKIRDI